MDGQDHHQLKTFRKNAGFEFSLRTEDGAEIHIHQSHFGGTVSSNDGGFQAFCVRLRSEQSDAIRKGVPYTLHPVRDSEKYSWTVDQDVTLVRP